MRDPVASYRRWARFIVGAAIANLALCVGVAGIRSAEPERFGYVVPRAEGLWIIGANRFGLHAVKRFDKLEDCERFLAERGLELDAIEYVRPAQSERVEWKAVETNGRAHYKVVWQGAKGPGVLHTPDAASAKRVAEYLRYQELRPGEYGYGLPLRKLY